jgi:hypothetical protein
MPQQIARILWFTKLYLVDDKRFINYHAPLTQPVPNARDKRALQVIETDNHVIGTGLNAKVPLQVGHPRLQGDAGPLSHFRVHGSSS